MANNYFEGTGVLKLKQVTPVIKALFYGYDLEEDYPGNGQASIAVGDNIASADWDTWQEQLESLCETLKIQLPDSSVTLHFVIEALMLHFGTLDRVESQKLLLSELDRQRDFSDQPELNWLFALAKMLDDGHGLEFMTFEAAWYCSKLRLGEQGGIGTFYSSTINLESSSSEAISNGQYLHNAIIDKCYKDAGGIAYTHANYLLTGIVDVDVRQQVAQIAISHLSQEYNPMPHYSAASNEPTNPYEKPPFVLTLEERRDEHAQAIYDIAYQWIEHPTEDLKGRVLGAVRDVVGLFEYGNAEIPPMQLTPVISVGNKLQTVALRPNEFGKNEFEPAVWQYGTAMPVATPEQGIAKTFEALVSDYDKRRIDAAKQMFGN